VERREGDGALASVQEALSKPNTEEGIWILVVVLRQLAQQAADASMIGTSTNHPKRKDLFWGDASTNRVSNGAFVKRCR